MSLAADPIPLRRRIYPLLITVAVGAACGRILSVELVVEPSLSRPHPTRTAAAVLLPLAARTSPEAATLAAVGQETWRDADPDERPRVWPLDPPEPMPSFGSNDRSRWATIRALVDHGTYAVGYRDTDPETGQYRDRGIVTEDGWQTIDKVLKPEPAGQTRRFYSSKPPLLTTLLAGEYWLLKHLFGWSITADRWLVMRAIVLATNGLPWAVYLLLLARLVERFGVSDWGRLYVLAAAGFGTFLTTFLVTLNNHSIAGYGVVFALYPALTAWAAGRGGGAAPWYAYALAGFFAAFTACCELPAASFAVALLVLLLAQAPGRTLAFAVPAAAVPVAAFFLTNYLAIGQLSIAYGEFGGPWYEYEGSHWKREPGQVKHGIDFADEPKAVYAFHLLLGHHGLFSLSPVLLLALAGMLRAAVGLGRRLARPGGEPDPAARPEDGTASNLGPGTLRTVAGVLRRILRRLTGAPELTLVGSVTLVLTLVVVGFFVYRTNNYGGWTSGPRWLFWLTPLWLLSLLPVADRLAGYRWGRGLAYLLLAFSVLSVSYPAWNPWRHPWLYNLLGFHY